MSRPITFESLAQRDWKRSRFEHQPTFAYGLHELLEWWMAPETLKEGIVSREEGIVDETTNGGYREPMHRARREPGSTPVLLHDDEFRFEVNLNTGGLESGEVHFSDRIVGPKISCDLVAVGTGATTAEGNGIVDYSGTCTFKK